MPDANLTEEQMDKAKQVAEENGYELKNPQPVGESTEDALAQVDRDITKAEADAKAAREKHEAETQRELLTEMIENYAKFSKEKAGIEEAVKPYEKLLNEIDTKIFIAVSKRAGLMKAVSDWLGQTITNSNTRLNDDMEQGVAAEINILREEVKMLQVKKEPTNQLISKLKTEYQQLITRVANIKNYLTNENVTPILDKLGLEFNPDEVTK